MKLYIVRHGQTGYNIDNKVCGISDVELTSLGKQQAKMASEQLKDISLDMIFASPLQRAHETAKIINENLLSCTERPVVSVSRTITSSSIRPKDCVLARSASVA